MKRLLNALGIVLVIALALAINGCGSGSSGSSGSSNTRQNETANLKVNVYNSNSRPLSNAVVVLNNPDGRIFAHGTTDANGSITFANPPANAIVTAAYNRCSLGSISTYYIVNSPELSFELFDCNLNDPQMTVSVTDGMATDHWKLQGPEFQTDGKVSAVAIGYDTDGKAVGYGSVLDLVYTPGMMTDILLNKTDLVVEPMYFNNIPATATSYTLEAGSKRKKGTAAEVTLSGAPIASVNMPFVPDFGDVYRYEASMYMGPDFHVFTRGSALRASQTFDFSQGMAMPSDLAIAGNGTNRPVFSWKSNESTTQVISVYIPDNRHELIVPPSKTSVVFPELPDSLAAFRPSTIPDFTVSNLKYDFAASYEDFLDKINKYYTGAWAMPAEWESKQSTKKLNVPVAP